MSRVPVQPFMQSTNTLQPKLFAESELSRLKATPCGSIAWGQSVRRRNDDVKTAYAQKFEAHESQRNRIQESGRRRHEDRIADRETTL